MEGQHMPGGGPPKVKAKKAKTRDPAAEGSHTQAVRKSKQPDVANWDGYAAADPNPAYPEHYGYGEDAHGYGYSGQGHGYVEGTHGYGYGDGTQGWDANQGHGYTHGYGYGDGTQDYGYAQGYDYGDGTGGYGYGDGAPGYEALQAAKDKPKKPKKLKKPAAEGSYDNQQPSQGGHQVDEYGQPLHDGHTYNAAPNPTKPHKRDPSKSRNPSKVKFLERASHSDGAYVDPGNGVYVDPSYAAHHGDGAYVDPSYAAHYGDGAYVDPSYDGAYVDPSYDGAYVDPGYAAHHGDGVNANATVPYKPKVGKKSKDTASYEDFQAGSALSSRAMSRVHGDDSGSARSRSSQEGPAPGRARSSDREGSGSNRAKPHRENEMRSSRRTVENEGKSNPNRNALNDHLRKASKAMPPDSMVVFNDPSDRTLVDVKGTQARSELNEWLKQQPHHGNNTQEVSLIVQPDDNKEMLETKIFGKKLAMTLPPVVEAADQPQYRQALVENPPYQQPLQRRPRAANTNHVGDELQVVETKKEPNAKCMACVHGVGVPITRALTRIVCKNGCTALANGCTIL